MEIWLKQGKTAYRFAVLPESFEIETAQNNTVVNITELGEISLLGNRKLNKITLTSFFPNQKYDFLQYSNISKPYDCVAKIEMMKEVGAVQLIITGANINMTCTIESFTYGEADGTGDVNFTIELQEYIKPKVTRVKTIKDAGTALAAPETQRASKQVGKTYTVKSGDCLSTIAAKQTGSASNWRAIYNKNKSVIGSNPKLIYAGQVLQL